MKCPNCAAEVQGKFCDFCGSEMPQEKPNVNITNNYYGNITQESEESNTGKCPQCGNSKITFKRERIGTVTQSVSRKNAFGSGRKGQSVSQAAYRTVGVCQSCGFTWDPESVKTNKKSNKKTWLWVLGWIFMFPIPLTILMLRKKDMKPAVKYGIIAGAWILYLIIGIAGNAGTETPSVESPTNSIVEQNSDIDSADEFIESIQQTTNSTENQENNSTASNSVEIAMPHNSYYFMGNERPVGYVVAELEKLGFTNINTIEVEAGIYKFAVEDVKIYDENSSKAIRFDEGEVFGSDSLIEVYYYGGPLEDGMIQKTNIFSIESQLKNIEGYSWSEEHKVTEGRTGFYGTCFCEDREIWCSLYGNDLEEITTANIDVYEDDFELLIAFAGLFDTSLIDGQAVQQWIRESDPKSGSVSEIFGDAEFTLSYGLDAEEKYSLYVTALE